LVGKVRGAGPCEVAPAPAARAGPVRAAALPLGS